MNQQAFDLDYRIEHQHPDGSRGEMVEVSQHDVASHDPERRWDVRRIFRCACGHTMIIAPDADGAVEPDPT